MPMELHTGTVQVTSILSRRFFVSEALMAARWSSKPEVAGSIPAAHFFAGVAQGMSRRLVSGRIWVRIPSPALVFFRWEIV